jgi:hypothetical protein
MPKTDSFGKKHKPTPQSQLFSLNLPTSDEAGERDAAYESYLLFCERLGITPARPGLYFRETAKISHRHDPDRMLQVLPRPA